MRKIVCILILQLVIQCFGVERTNSRYNTFEYSAANKPHPDKVAKGGEDAYFANEYLFAVADGVGGWGTHGVDPSHYSRGLCSSVDELLKLESNKYVNNPKKLMKDAWSKVSHIGSATFVIAELDRRKPILRTANVGDSGYIIYRKEKNGWKMIFQSDEMQKSFNFPYQLAAKPEHGDNPNVAVEKEHTLKDGDVVVVGSDGLLDNLAHHQILRILRSFLSEGNSKLDVKGAADKLLAEAFKYSLDTNYKSPFARRAEQQGYAWKGGKSDDITLIVGQVKLGVQRDDEL